MIDKKIMALIALIPASPAIANQLGAQYSYELQPGEMKSIHLSENLSLQLSHAKISEKFSDYGVDTASDVIKVQFHEENNDIDFSTLDGYSVSVPLDEVTRTPPNIDGRGEF